MHLTNLTQCDGNTATSTTTTANNNNKLDGLEVLYHRQKGIFRFTQTFPLNALNTLQKGIRNFVSS